MDAAEQKRKAFAAAVFAGAEGKDAAIRAGYSTKTAAVAACRLLKHPRVLAELDRLKAQAGNRPAKKLSPLDFLLEVMNDAQIDPKLRVRAATAAAQYVHPRRAEGGKRDEAAEKAKQAATGRFARKAPPLHLVRKADEGAKE